MVAKERVDRHLPITKLNLSVKKLSKFWTAFLSDVEFKLNSL